jgi:hypothetical protein
MELLEKDMALLKEHVAVLENQFVSRSEQSRIA